MKEKDKKSDMKCWVLLITSDYSIFPSFHPGLYVNWSCVMSKRSLFWKSKTLFVSFVWNNTMIFNIKVQVRTFINLNPICDFVQVNTSTTPSCSGSIPAQRIWSNLVPGHRAVFSHTMPKMDLYYSHRVSWGKVH